MTHSPIVEHAFEAALRWHGRLAHVFASVAFALAIALCSTLLGDVTVTLPLQGHYRAGRYMPVHVAGTAEAGTSDAASIEISGDGVLSTAMPATGDYIEATLPVLVLQSHLENLQYTWTDGRPHRLAAPLHELSNDERLIAVMDVDPADAVRLFPGNRPIVIPLDMQTFTIAPAVAWTSLDALVLTAADLSRLSRDQQDILLAGGVALAIPARIGESPPDKRPLWQYQDRFWVMRAMLAGPRGASFNADAYAPTYSWVAQWPTSFRLRILLAVSVMSLIVLLISLWRRWLAAVLIVITLLAAMALFGWWRARHTPLLAIDGTVRVISHAAIQRDHWSYQAAPDATGGGFAFASLTYPIFAGRNHANMLDMSLICNAVGHPLVLEYHLPRSARIAMLSRSFDSSPVTAATSPALAPAAPSGLRELVRAVYLRPGYNLAGQVAGHPPSGTWPTLVIEPRSGN